MVSVNFPAAPTATEFRTRFGEFADTAAYPDADITAAIATARQIFAATREGTLYLTAHLLALAPEYTAPLDGGSGEVSGESVGGRQVSYQVMAKDASEVFYTRTSYGRSFLALRKQAPARVVSARVW